MAGMLPGVECARRRRFHHSINSSDSPSTAAKSGSTRRPSFCLYTSNRDFHLISSSSSQVIMNKNLKKNSSSLFCFSGKSDELFLWKFKIKQRSLTNKAHQNEKLGEIAREAKERLDERLRTHRKPENSRWLLHDPPYLCLSLL